MSGTFSSLDNGAMLTDNQAAAALANVAVYCDAFAVQVNNKAVERGLEADDMYVMAALSHITEVCAHAAVEYAANVGDTVRRNAFKSNLPAMYHIMNSEQALEIDGEIRAMALAGAVPTIAPESPDAMPPPEGVS
jgi:hypothetical protein